MTKGKDKLITTSCTSPLLPNASPLWCYPMHIDTDNIKNNLDIPDKYMCTFHQDVRAGTLEVCVWSKDTSEVSTCIGTIVFTYKELADESYNQKFKDFFYDRNLIERESDHD